MFRAEYLRLDDFLATTPSLISLKDLVQPTRTFIGNDNATWHVEPSGIRRRFPGRNIGSQTFVALPDEAILVSRLWFHQPSVRYWNASLFRGIGSVSDNYFVLVGTDKGSIAWLKHEFDLPYVQLQLRRRAFGQVAMSLSLEDLLDIQVQVPDLQVQSKSSREVIEETRVAATSLRTGRLRQHIELDDETLEAKLGSLERILVEHDLFAAANIFYVEPATSNHNSDLFTVRSCDDDLVVSPRFVPQDNPMANELWRDWFWNDTPSDRHKVFNSLVGDAPLPTYLLMYTVRTAPPSLGTHHTKSLLPNFATFCDSVVTSLEADLGVDDQVWAATWQDLQASFDTTHSEVRNRDSVSIDHEAESELFRWSRAIYRPVLAVRVLRENKVVGAYLLVGNDQIENPEIEFARLDDVGVDLSEALTQSSTRLEEVLRRESTRRLSELMHRLSGPILNATDALHNICEYLQKNSDIAKTLVPNEQQAIMLAEMNRDPTPDAYRLDSQVEAIENAIEQIRNVAHRVKTLARVEEQLRLRDFRLADLLTEIAQANRVLCGLITVSGCEGWVHADRDLIHVAIELVLDNAIRELRERNTAQPHIDVVLKASEEHVDIEITDNALPVDKSLRHDVMDEGVSTYFRAGKGSGYGLAIVRRTFERHGCKVSLIENVSESSSRLPGVTFRAVLPKAVGVSNVS